MGLGKAGFTFCFSLDSGIITWYEKMLRHLAPRSINNLTKSFKVRFPSAPVIYSIASSPGKFLVVGERKKETGVAVDVLLGDETNYWFKNMMIRSR